MNHVGQYCTLLYRIVLCSLILHCSILNINFHSNDTTLSSENRFQWLIIHPFLNARLEPWLRNARASGSKAAHRLHGQGAHQLTGTLSSTSPFIILHHMYHTLFITLYYASHALSITLYPFSVYHTLPHSLTPYCTPFLTRS